MLISILLLLFLFNYTVPLGDLNITMYYDEPIDEEYWESLEERDEKIHEEWAKENYDD